VHKHVELTADGRRRVSGQPVEIVHHVHLIVIAESVSDMGPLRKGRRRFSVEGRLEADAGAWSLRPAHAAQYEHDSYQRPFESVVHVRAAIRGDRDDAGK
jgi:hypothetical protein